MADITHVMIDDPRDPYEKLRKRECVEYGQKHNLPLSEFNENLPVVMLRRRLRELRIPVVPKSPPLGAPPGSAPMAPPPKAEPEKVIEVDADEDLAAQYRSYQTPAPKTVDQMTMTELRAGARERGIKMVRTDNMASLREKLKAHDVNNAAAVG